MDEEGNRIELWEPIVEQNKIETKLFQSLQVDL